MNPNLELFLGGIIATTVSMTEPKIMEELQKVHDKHPAYFKAGVYLALALLEDVSKAATKTETNLDDQSISSIMRIVKASAAKNGITV